MLKQVLGNARVASSRIATGCAPIAQNVATAPRFTTIKLATGVTLNYTAIAHR